MNSNMNFKIFHHFLWGIFWSLTTFSPIFAIPAPNSSVISKTTQIGDPLSAELRQNRTNGQTLNQLNSGKSREIQENVGIIGIIDSDIETKSNPLNSSAASPLPSNDLDINNKINGKSPVDQLTELSAIQMNTPSVENKFGNNEISTDLSQSTASPLITSNNFNISDENTTDKFIQQNIESDGQKPETNETMTSGTKIIEKPDQNLTTHNIINSSDQVVNQVNLSTNKVVIEETHRNKRSFGRSSLHSNLDELLNMKRQRRASMRSKRNTNYEDILASLLAAEEAKYNNNYDSYPDKSDLNQLAMNYILNNVNSDDSDTKYVDLDQLNQYYYQNLLPLIENIETDSDSVSDGENVSQDIPIIVQPFSKSVIPVIPYSLPNRYQRIQRSFVNRYRNPISVYTGLKKKRAHINRGEWGRIVGANSERSANDDEAQEASKIYSLATLLATGGIPEEQRLRYKRSVKRSVKPVMTFKNM